jgi:hypothetical protein
MGMAASSFERCGEMEEGKTKPEKNGLGDQWLQADGYGSFCFRFRKNKQKELTAL